MKERGSRGRDMVPRLTIGKWIVQGHQRRFLHLFSALIVYGYWRVMELRLALRATHLFGGSRR